MSTSANKVAGAVIATVLAAGAFLPIGSGCSSQDDKDGKQGAMAGSAPIAGGGMGGSALQPPPPGGSGANTPPPIAGSSGSAAGSGGSGAHDAGALPSTSDDDDAGRVSAADAGDDDLPRRMQPIDAPVADDCIKDVSA